uniref:Ribosomal protein L14 n=1 Tax=Crocodylus porosus TaxID=8502 RepID=A0A7M4ECT1_CROPO
SHEPAEDGSRPRHSLQCAGAIQFRKWYLSAAEAGVSLFLAGGHHGERGPRPSLLTASRLRGREGAGAPREPSGEAGRDPRWGRGGWLAECGVVVVCVCSASCPLLPRRCSSGSWRSAAWPTCRSGRTPAALWPSWTSSTRTGARQKHVRTAWEKENINEKWAGTRWAKKIEAREKKAKMTDFDRYKVMKAKKMRNRIIKHEIKKLQKQTSKKAS